MERLISLWRGSPLVLTAGLVGMMLILLACTTEVEVVKEVEVTREVPLVDTALDTWSIVMTIPTLTPRRRLTRAARPLFRWSSGN